MTDKVTKRRQRKKKDPELVLPNNTPIPDSDDTRSESLEVLTSPCIRQRQDSVATSTWNSPEAEPRHLALEQEGVVALSSQFRLPAIYQPSLAVPEALDNLFISHFVALNTGVRSYHAETPWIALLPGLQSRATTPALKFSLRAVSMALWAKFHRNAPVLVDSYRWYTRSLKSQRMAIAKLNTGRLPTDEECLAPIILGLYEVYAGTTPSTVFQHLAAAAQIVAMRGPWNCTAEDALPLFIALRVSEAHKAIVFNRPSVFSTPEWMTIPFILTPKTAHMHLTDILLAIPGCIRLTGTERTLSGFFVNPLPLNVDLDPVRLRTLHLLGDLDRWAKRHPHLCTTMPARVTCTTEDMTTPIDTSTPESPSSAVKIPNTFVAMATTAYKAAHLILTLLLEKVSPTIAVDSEDASPESPSPSASLLEQATEDAKDILKLSIYMESTHPVGFIFLRCVFPLVVVCILGPSREDRKAAREILDRWGAERGLGGLAGSWVSV
ncbi:hypothetical protein M011DRAFT_479524 [Sporormia fimetaria CBS 119925]|uniref:Uncharacterized protein n=1 Tax=Sporormia fimetaria CBS 119925 TaxID=1340428 RepID=A0A6A6V4X2_9PLEO|nr:hypothetical protein M011DRAFT_479524 [Sporormia fimetaria CBS 119925]